MESSGGRHRHLIAYAGTTEGKHSLDAGKYLTILRRGWLILIMAMLLGAAAGSAYSLTQPKQYRATATVFLSLNRANTTGELSQGANYLSTAVISYSRIATMPLVLDEVAKRLRYDPANGSLASKITATTTLDTALIDISAVDQDPVAARDIAQAVAEELQNSVAKISPENDERQQAVRVVMVSPAVAPKAPFAPQTTMNTAVAGLAGCALAIGFLILREALDNRVRDEETLSERLGLPILASVPHDPSTTSSLLANLPHSARSESFRQLRTNLQYIDYTGGLRSVVITSASSGEGKTTTAVNLAEATTALGVSVLLVDADLRRPRVHEHLGLEGSVGLSTVLAGLADAQDVVQQFGEKNLYVLPAGHIPPNPSELLGSQSMAHLLNELCELFDLVILDAAPVLPVTDPTVLGMLTDGVVLVANARRTTIDSLEKTSDTLTAAGVRILGAVLNQAAPRKSTYYDAHEAAARSDRESKRGQSSRTDHKSGRTAKIVGKRPVARQENISAARMTATRGGASTPRAGTNSSIGVGGANVGGGPASAAVGSATNGPTSATASGARGVNTDDTRVPHLRNPSGSTTSASTSASAGAAAGGLANPRAGTSVSPSGGQGTGAAQTPEVPPTGATQHSPASADEQTASIPEVPGQAPRQAGPTRPASPARPTVPGHKPGPTGHGTPQPRQGASPQTATNPSGVAQPTQRPAAAQPGGGPAMSNPPPGSPAPKPGADSDRTFPPA